MLGTMQYKVVGFMFNMQAYTQKLYYTLSHPCMLCGA